MTTCAQPQTGWWKQRSKKAFYSPESTSSVRSEDFLSSSCSSLHSFLSLPTVAFLVTSGSQRPWQRAVTWHDREVKFCWHIRPTSLKINILNWTCTTISPWKSLKWWACFSILRADTKRPVRKVNYVLNTRFWVSRLTVGCLRQPVKLKFPSKTFMEFKKGVLCQRLGKMEVILTCFILAPQLRHMVRQLMLHFYFPASQLREVKFPCVYPHAWHAELILIRGYRSCCHDSWQCFKHCCCCEEATRCMTSMLPTHLKTDNTEDLYNH